MYLVCLIPFMPSAASCSRRINEHLRGSAPWSRDWYHYNAISLAVINAIDRKPDLNTTNVHGVPCPLNSSPKSPRLGSLIRHHRLRLMAAQALAVVVNLLL